MDKDLQTLSNCFFFAVELFIRRILKGERGYIKMRKSDYGRFPHFLYEREGPTGVLRVVSFVPNNPKLKALPPPLFPGHVKWGDPNPHARVKHPAQANCRARHAPGKRIKKGCRYNPTPL